MSALETVQLAQDELEAMRLCDYEHCDQAEAGKCMGVSRGTIYRLLHSGRAKVLEAILTSKALIIETDENKCP